MRYQARTEYWIICIVFSRYARARFIRATKSSTSCSDRFNEILLVNIAIKTADANTPKKAVIVDTPTQKMLSKQI